MGSCCALLVKTVAIICAFCAISATWVWSRSTFIVLVDQEQSTINELQKLTKTLVNLNDKSQQELLDTALNVWYAAKFLCLSIVINMITTIDNYSVYTRLIAGKIYIKSLYRIQYFILISLQQHYCWQQTFGRQSRLKNQNILPVTFPLDLRGLLGH